MRKALFLILLGCALYPAVVLAHQPRIVRDVTVKISDPDISRAYYDDLQGEPRLYLVSSETGFTLYLNLLVPKDANPGGRYSASVYPVGISTSPVAVLDGASAPWNEYFEKFGRDWYLQGPELRRELPAGTYAVVVSGNNDRGKYTLAIGEKETFPIREMYNAVRLLPTLKSWFFGRSPVTFVFTIFGAGYLIIMFALAFVAGFVFRTLVGKFFKDATARQVKNLGLPSRWLRGSLGVLFLLLGLYSWHPLVLFMAGFLFFESCLGWCALNSLLGRSDCPGAEC